MSMAVTLDDKCYAILSVSHRLSVTVAGVGMETD